MRTLVHGAGGCGFMVLGKDREPSCLREPDYEVDSAVNGQAFYACTEHLEQVRECNPRSVGEVRPL